MCCLHSNRTNSRGALFLKGRGKQKELGKRPVADAMDIKQEHGASAAKPRKTLTIAPCLLHHFTENIFFFKKCLL